jgi:hypothetical protein
MLGFCIISTSNSKKRSARAKDKASGAKEENVSAHKRMPLLGYADEVKACMEPHYATDLTMKGGGGGQ